MRDHGSLGSPGKKSQLKSPGGHESRKAGGGNNSNFVVSPEAVMHDAEGVIYRCLKHKCFAYFRSAEMLRRHASRHIPDEAKAFMCPEPECGRRFTQKSSLNRHRRKAKHMSTDSFLPTNPPAASIASASASAATATTVASSSVAAAAPSPRSAASSPTAPDKLSDLSSPKGTSTTTLLAPKNKPAAVAAEPNQTAKIEPVEPEDTASSLGKSKTETEGEEQPHQQNQKGIIENSKSAIEGLTQDGSAAAITATPSPATTPTSLSPVSPKKESPSED
jgi:hypothetical protein